MTKIHSHHASLLFIRHVEHDNSASTQKHKVLSGPVTVNGLSCAIVLVGWKYFDLCIVNFVHQLVIKYDKHIFMN